MRKSHTGQQIRTGVFDNKEYMAQIASFITIRHRAAMQKIRYLTESNFSEDIIKDIREKFLLNTPTDILESYLSGSLNQIHQELIKGVCKKGASELMTDEAILDRIRKTIEEHREREYQSDSFPASVCYQSLTTPLS